MAVITLRQPSLPCEPAGGEARAGLEALKAELRRLEGHGGKGHASRPLGLAPIDIVLPGRGLQGGALHEIVAAEGDEAAAQGFAAAMLRSIAGQGTVLWCLDTAELYGPGLARLGLSPERLILVRASRPRDLLWAMEEGLRTPGLAAVMGEPRLLDLTASRRLQLAAEASGVICLVLSRAGTASATVAVTRWQVASAPSGTPFGADSRDFGLARARWRVDLTRCRGATPRADGRNYGTWLVEEGHGPTMAAIARPMAEDTSGGFVVSHHPVLSRRAASTAK